MPIPINSGLAEQHREITRMLRKLNFSVHRIGYKHLTVAILRYAQDDTQSLSKEVYPYVAHSFGYSDWRAVERSIRVCIVHAWVNQDSRIWNQYFPRLWKAPSNKLVIATLAEQLKEKPSHFREG